MGTITEGFAAAFRDFVTEGVPASGERDPVKSEVRAIGPLIESAIGNIALSGVVDVVHETKAALDADLAHAENSVGLVYGDATDANNDLYVKSGASGAGAWSNTNILHDAISSAGAPILQAADSAANNAEDFAHSINDALGDIARNAAAYAGDAAIHPLLTDKQGEVLVGFDSEADALVARGLVDQAKLGRALDANFTGASGMVPILADAAGNVLAGYDADSDKGYLRGVTDAPQPAPPELVSVPPVPAAVNHVLAYGQSLSVGANSGALVSTTQPFDNITFIGGPRAWSGSAYAFAPFKPLVEDSTNPAPDGNTSRGETPCSGTANYASVVAAIEYGVVPADHVILASTAGHGGWRIGQLEKGQAWYSANLLRHVSEAVALESDYACQLVDWIQGENDGLSETAFETYRSKLDQLIDDVDADIRALSGQTTPVYFSISVTAGYAAAWRQVQLAQRAVARSNPLAFIATPLYPFMNQSNTDGLHLVSAAMVRRSAYVGRAYSRLVHGGVKPKWLDAISATLRGSQVRVKLDVPVRPLQFDTITVGFATDYGFAVEDSGGLVTIDRVFIDGDTIVIDLAAAPTGDVYVRYALDYLGTNVTITGGASGNVCDSAPETITVAGREWQLKNFLVPFSLVAINLGA